MPVQPPTDDASPDRPGEGPTPSPATPAVPSVPDEEWDRFLADSEREIRSSAPKEPSARARQVARRLREQDELAVARAKRERKWYKPWGRRKQAGARPGEPAGWRTGPAWQEMRGGRRTGRRRLGTVLVLVVLVAGVLVVLNPSAPLSFLRRGERPADSAPQYAPATPDPSPTEDIPTPARPFAGSPAETWADGAGGIVPPAAKAVGSMTKAQVAEALRLTKQYLVATNLDPATLRGGSPASAIRLIDPVQTKLIQEIDQDLRHPSAKHNPLIYLTRYNPAQLRLVGSVVKVKGTMTVREGEYGSVEVHADYSFVYPFAKADDSTRQISRSIVRRVLVTRVYPAGRVRATPGRLWLANLDEDTFNTACRTDDGYLHPGFLTDPSAGGPTSGPTVDPYDLTQPVTGLPGVCSTVSRT